MVTLTNQQARQFILLKQGLLGEHKFVGKQGTLDFIRQAGCIQFDPVDICGKNAEITLQSRVKGFKKEMLHELLYKDRLLFDYPDKQLSIIPLEYWSYFERFRNAARMHLHQYAEIEEHIETARKIIHEQGAVCSEDFNLEGSTEWRSAINWSAGGKMSRSVLEQMYSSGDLIVHHKNGARRYYDFTERHISPDILSAPEPLEDDFAHIKWRVLRRIGAVGLMWNRPSDVWLNIGKLPTNVRSNVLDSLIDEGEIAELCVEGLKDKFYFRACDMPIVEQVLTKPAFKPRCELIAPLDPLMWDRKLVKVIFGFEYSWEIYTPPHKRKYGAYVLPLLCGEQFVGRVEAIREKKTQTLVMKNIWHEDGMRWTKKQEAMLGTCLKRFAVFNGCSTVLMPSCI